ncbi:hypothetical protein TVAG_239150 [Trichomonas vaginalis G3]|uniref:Ubiquitin-like domain-containing protein n=1 Tax=Trichomonas vaginalis (strain ATCC PRA-98 / G3) TaxID=412133 RepID=A2DGE6_TRIV3|nr:ubiquitin-like family [Trichomonas vaginalis G3]EAY20542.1 hypothetical protein TVAG_239150 [Trichomonas vaginalis G3]KAI5488266.1 ubiquitin-like family [Trichomonas vaginalis G3]|eukprot:XP_001581528.1 hypothetical protein [Trichomonas vaginalis G3]
MESNWRTIGENISKYIDDDEFLSNTKPLQMCKILNYATLTSNQFANLFKNLSEHYGKDDMFKMMSRARTVDFKTFQEVEEVEDTFNSVLGIPTLSKIFSFYKNSPRTEANSKPNKFHASILPRSISLGCGGYRVIIKISGLTTDVYGVRDDMDSTEFLKQIAQAAVLTDLSLSPHDFVIRLLNGKTILNSHPLSDYKMHDGSVLKLYLRSRV